MLYYMHIRPNFGLIKKNLKKEKIFVAKPFLKTAKFYNFAAKKASS